MKKLFTILTVTFLLTNCVKTPRAALDSPLGLLILQMLGGAATGGLHELSTVDVKGFYNPYDKNLYFLGYNHDQSTNSDYMQVEKFTNSTNSLKFMKIGPRASTGGWYNAVGDDRFDPGFVYSFLQNGTAQEGHRVSLSGGYSATIPPSTYVGPWQSVTSDGRPLIVDNNAGYLPNYLSSAAGATTFVWTAAGIAPLATANITVLGLYKNSISNFEYVILNCPTTTNPCNGFATSADGITWSTGTAPGGAVNSGVLVAITFAYGKYYYITNSGTSTNIYSLAGGTIAQVGTSIANYTATSIATNGTSIVINGSPSGTTYGNPVIYHSQDGVTFAQAPAITTNATWPNPNTWIVYYEPINKFIISGGRVNPTSNTGGGDRIMSSADGITWGFN